MFEKRLIGAYCNRLYDLREKQAPFHAKAELKQAAQEKILMSPILIQQRAHHIGKHAYHNTAYFLMSQHDHHLGYAINFFILSSPSPHSYSEKLRMVVCVIVLCF